MSGTERERNVAHSRVLKTSEIFAQCFLKHTVYSLVGLNGTYRGFINVNCFISAVQFHQ